MRKRYTFKHRLKLHIPLLLICVMMGAGSSMAYANRYFEVLSMEPQTQNPLKVEVTLNVKNLTLSQFIKELQKKVGDKAFFNMPVDGLTNDAADITFNGKSTIEEVLSTVLPKRNLSYTLKGNVFMIIKQARKMLQNIAFTVVDDRTNKPIVGATLLVSGTSNGAISNDQGKAIIKDVAENSPIEITMVGYKESKIYAKAVKDGTVVRMELKSYDIDDVVVTGYQKN